MSEKSKIFEIYLTPETKSNFFGILHKNIRILEIGSNYSIGASGYCLYKLINGERFFLAKLNDRKNSILSKNKLTKRFFRAEIFSHRTLKNNVGICIAKKGIFLENSITRQFEKVFNVVRGSRPMAICEDRDGTIFFGEYYYNKKRNRVHIFASYDSGKNWNIIYTFPPKTVRHIHTIQLDPYTGFLWIATGDENEECFIGYTKDGFKTLEIVAKGGQEFRTCNFLFQKDKIIYGTDSPYVENYLKAINRTDFSFKLLQKVQGSIINACQIGNICIISTTVEPSQINRDRNSYIWISDNGEKWMQIGCFTKDIFNSTLFQFGNIRFPHYNTSDTDSLYFSGHALKKIDGHSVELDNLSDYFKLNTK